MLTVDSSQDETVPSCWYENRGWARDLTVWNGEERSVFVAVREWQDEEMERVHKAEERDWSGEGRPLWVDVFHERLRERGMIGWEEVHGLFNRCHEKLPYETAAAKRKRMSIK